jgi:hypothetical protein
MNILETKELKLRFKKNATTNEIWIDPCFNNNHFYQDLLNLFGEPELYTYEHQFDPALGDKVLNKHPSKGFLIYRVKYSLDKDNGCWIIVNDKKIQFNYKLQKAGKITTINYQKWDGKCLSVTVNSYYASDMVVKELVNILIKENV